ncbi:MAG: cupin domain-containing protein [Actinobacteria bacterium]|nr:cupin domain-containing protein [Actinomycetota bacterium]
MASGPKQIAKRSFDTPDEHRSFSAGTTDVVTVGGMTLGLARYEPGWRWSKDIKPIVGTESCEVEHLGYLVSGRMGAKMNDGSELEFAAGDLVYIPPGHDGWIVGDEPAVFLQIMGAGAYAQQK